MMLLALFAVIDNAIVGRQVGAVTADLKVTSGELENVAEKFKIHVSRFEQIEGRLDRIESRLITTEERLDTIEQLIAPSEPSGRIYQSLTAALIQDNSPFSYYDIPSKKWEGYDLDIMGEVTGILGVPEGKVHIMQVADPHELLRKRCDYDMAFASLKGFSADELTGFYRVSLTVFIPDAEAVLTGHGLLVSICDKEEDAILARDVMLSVYGLPAEFWQELVQR